MTPGPPGGRALFWLYVTVVVVGLAWFLWVALHHW